MKNGIIGSFRQLMKKKVIIVSVLVAVLVMINYIEPLLRIYRNAQVLQKGYHAELYKLGLESDALSFFLPILAVLPFGGCYVDDIKNKFVRFFIIRSSYRIYFVSRILVGFIAGALTIFLGILLAGVITAGSIIPFEVHSIHAATSQINDITQTCALLIINGGFWSVFGLSMSTIMESKYIAYASPFVLYYLLVILHERYFPNFIIIYPKIWTNPAAWPYGFWGAVIVLLEMTVVSSLIFVLRGKRRLNQL